jgi:lipoprotein-releasing system ATP-binding protein
VSLLSLKNIHKSFAQANEEYKVLTGVNFQVNKGEVVSLLGPSGSGKSTFLLIAGLLENPTHGSIIFDGIDCSLASDDERTRIRRENIGFVYQSHHLLPEFTLLENVMIPRMLTSTNEKESKEEAIALLTQFGLASRLNNLPSEASGGEQQRAAIARSLINQPQLILADEPTGNLDEQNSNIVMDIIINKAKEKGLAAIIVTHNIELAKKTDSIFILKGGLISQYS